MCAVMQTFNDTMHDLHMQNINNKKNFFTWYNYRWRISRVTLVHLTITTLTNLEIKKCLHVT